ncbi:MAG: glycosyltransferase family 4 protein [Chloroflexi bacterium]|nr:glycosyltransferase family 4 protein [Chloroflexota bacterium]
MDIENNISVTRLQRVVVVHAGNRDHYQVALALYEAGLLEKLVTDVYFPLDQPWFMRTVGRLLPMELLSKRYCPGLPSDKVCSTAKALGVIIANRLLTRQNLHPISDGILGRKARLLAQQTQTVVLSYSTYAAEALRPTAFHAPMEQRPRLLFQMHPHPASAQRILREELLLLPDASASLLQEHEMSIPPRVYEQLVIEPTLADSVMVASTFCARTLVENGISEDRLKVIPYGVDPVGFPEKPTGTAPGEPLRLVFLGSIVQRKGIAYLLDAMRILKEEPVQLTLCGRVAPDVALIERYHDCKVEVKIGLSHAEVLQELHDADLFVFPSLLEGFAHVILEAMSCGLPVITTPNTCGPDVIVHGKHGFIVPIRDSKVLVDRISWCLKHRHQLAEMGHQAAIRAREFTWDKFRQNVRQAYCDLLNCEVPA